MGYNGPEGGEVFLSETFPECFLVLRLDGKNFSKFTKSFKKDDEYSPEINAAMHAATLALLRQIDGAVAAYTVSDEISLVLDWTQRYAHGAWYGARAQKVFSVPSAIAAAEFSISIEKPAYFDTKVFMYSAEGLPDIRKYLLKRHNNGFSNAISSYASRHLGHKTVHDVPTSERLVMLGKAGVEVNKNLAHGHLFLRETFESDVEYTHKKTGERKVVVGVERHAWVPRLLESETQLVKIQYLRKSND